MFKDYHFNKWTKDKEGEFFKIIGRFDCNFTKEISLVRKTRMKTKRFNEQPYTYANNKASTIDGVYHALEDADNYACLLYTSPSPRDCDRSRMPSSA